MELKQNGSRENNHVLKNLVLRPNVDEEDLDRPNYVHGGGNCGAQVEENANCTAQFRTEISRDLKGINYIL